jgi:ribosomal protein S18 acetylase RimI-like enzyme
MKNFDYTTERIETDALFLEYFLVPWDTEILGQSVGDIRRLEVKDTLNAGKDYLAFKKWIERNNIILCSARLTHDKIVESMFLENQGFRFIEMNYHPQLKNLQSMEFPKDEIVIEMACSEDRILLSEIAGSVFQHGRFHQDPRMGVEIGNKRYKTWVLNSFEMEHQKVYKCIQNGRIVAFFVVEHPEVQHCFWSLVGLVADLQGQGLGKRVWRAMLNKHQQDGVETVSTSISSHNIRVLNLYVSLGFRFPIPYMMFHWCPTEHMT